MLLQGRNAIITGANQGLGLAIAGAFVTAGANVMLCARDAAKLEDAANALRSSGRIILTEPADVSREDDCHRVVRRAIEQFGTVEILVNNAGIYGPLGPIEENDWEEWKRALEINLYGPVLMSRAILPHLRKAAYGKIIQISGGGATNPLPRISSYAASKAAVVRFAETLAEETRGSGIDVNSLAPGALNTRLLDQVLEAGAERVGASFYERALRQKEAGGAPLERGADLAVFLASSSSDGLTGKLLSALWDPWEELMDKLPSLPQDVYTLRRIVPKDRGIDWGDK